MTALKDRIQTAANSVKTGKALIETSIIKSGGTVPKANAIPTFAELCGGVNNLHKIKITTSVDTLTFPETGGDIEVTINSNTVIEVTVPLGIALKSNQYPFMGNSKRSYGTTKYVFSRYGWTVNAQYTGNIMIRALVNDVVVEKIMVCRQSVAANLLFGIEYTPGQADDRVDYIGDAAANRNKPIQSMMRPFEMKMDGTDKAYLQDDVRLRVDGAASHVTDMAYLQLADIPEFWYGYIYDSVRNKNQVWFSCKAKPGYMHIAKQSITRYSGNRAKDGYARSYSGCMMSSSDISFTQWHNAAQKTRPDMFVMNYYLWNALAFLMVHDFGRRNAQSVYYGLSTPFNIIQSPTGTTNILPTPSGEVPGDDKTFSKKPFRWRFLENIYAYAQKIGAGAYIENSKMLVCSNPYEIPADGTIASSSVKVCDVPGYGYIMDVHLPWGVAKSINGSSTTGYCDLNSSSSGTETTQIILVGGPVNNDERCGPFYLHGFYMHNQTAAATALFTIISREAAATQIVIPAT